MPNAASEKKNNAAAATAEELLAALVELVDRQREQLIELRAAVTELRASVQGLELRIVDLLEGDDDDKDGDECL